MTSDARRRLATTAATRTCRSHVTEHLPPEISNSMIHYAGKIAENEQMKCNHWRRHLMEKKQESSRYSFHKKIR